MKTKTVICPECHSVYNADPSLVGPVFEIGEECGNASFTPAHCTPAAPCRGRLERGERVVDLQDHETVRKALRSAR
jgi:hypothetical protein